jgi:hypothetical protein
MNELQANLLITGLQLEIDTWENGKPRMQMTRESSLSAFTRLSGIKGLRGVKGRQEAIQILQQALADSSQAVSA